MTDKPFRLDDPPVIHVLASIRFNQVRAIEGSLTDFEKQVIRRDYVDRIETFQQKVDFIMHGAKSEQQPSLEVSADKVWAFVHKSKEYSITLTQESISLQASVYSKFEPFRKELLSCLKDLEAVLGNDVKLVKRLGLRYVNLIHLRDKDPFFWVNREFLGGGVLATKAQSTVSRVEKLAALPMGRIAVRYSDISGQPPLPAGISPSGLRVPAHVLAVSPQKRFILLDLDRHVASPIVFDPDEIIEVFSGFNDDCEQAFREVTTVDAKVEWKEVKS